MQDCFSFVVVVVDVVVCLFVNFFYYNRCQFLYVRFGCTRHFCFFVVVVLKSLSLLYVNSKRRFATPVNVK